MSVHPPERPAVLLVDDSDGELELMRYYLDPWAARLRVDCATNGVEALDYLARRGSFAQREGAEPCLIIIDNKMPGMNGIDAAGEMRKMPELAKVPIVMWSGSSNPEDIRRAYENGVTSYLVKPSGPGLAKEALQTVVRYWTDLHRRK
jgi:CheY-like chemotaxis protein